MELLIRKELSSLNILQNARSQYENAVKSFHNIFLELLQETLEATGNPDIITTERTLDNPSTDTIGDYSAYLTYRLKGKENYIVVKLYGIFETFIPIIAFEPRSNEEFNPEYDNREDMKSYFKGGNPEIDDLNNTEQAFSPEMLTEYINWITKGEVSETLQKKLIENVY